MQIQQTHGHRVTRVRVGALRRCMRVCVLYLYKAALRRRWNDLNPRNRCHPPTLMATGWGDKITAPPAHVQHVVVAVSINDFQCFQYKGAALVFPWKAKGAVAVAAAAFLVTARIDLDF